MTLMPYNLIFLVPFSVVMGYSLGGAFNFMTPVFVFGVIPVVDILIGKSKENPTEAQEVLLLIRSPTGPSPLSAYRFRWQWSSGVPMS